MSKWGNNMNSIKPEIELVQGDYYEFSDTLDFQECETHKFLYDARKYASESRLLANSVTAYPLKTMSDATPTKIARQHCFKYARKAISFRISINGQSYSVPKAVSLAYDEVVAEANLAGSNLEEARSQIRKNFAGTTEC